MPQLLGLVFLGAGLIAGFRAFQRIAGKTRANEAADPDANSRSGGGQLREKDLGTLERDPTSGIYRPRHPL